MLPDNRTIGIEIECLAPPSYTGDVYHVGEPHHTLARLINAYGVPCNAYDYTHRITKDWKVTTDGSLRDTDISTERTPRGMELVSPIFHRHNGFPQIDTVCKGLNDFQATVNKSCGLHVHVDVKNLNLGLDGMKRLALLYVQSEEILDSLMPISRRGNASTYIHGVKNTNTTAIEIANDVSAIANALASDLNGTGRYTKLNYLSYFKFGTVEFRHHSGTISATKIKNWVLACQRMVEAAANPANIISAAQVRHITKTIRQGTKRAIIYQMLTKPEGTTSAEIRAAINWPQCNVLDHAKALGLELTKRRINVGGARKVFRYWGKVATETVEGQAARMQIIKPTTVDQFADMLGMTDDEKQFWRDRAALLADIQT